MQLALVEQICPVSRNVHRVSLILEKPIPFMAGQYLKLWLNQEVYRSYSIANSDYVDNKIDIFIGYGAKNSIAVNLIDSMHLTGRVYTSLPYGNAYYRCSESNRIIIIVGGTGYAYGKSIALQALKDKYHKSICFLWKINHENGMFEFEILEQLKREYKNFQFSIFLNRKKEIFENIIYRNLKENNLFISKTDFYLAGNLLMIEKLKKYLYGLNVNKTNIYGDII